MIEFDGTYSERDKIHGITDPNSGGNVLLVTPSIWLSTDQWFVQLGVSVPVVQQLNGQQQKLWFIIDYNIGVAVQF
jgi:hypothetical protein